MYDMLSLDHQEGEEEYDSEEEEFREELMAGVMDESVKPPALMSDDEEADLGDFEAAMRVPVERNHDDSESDMTEDDENGDGGGDEVEEEEEEQLDGGDASADGVGGHGNHGGGENDDEWSDVESNYAGDNSEMEADQDDVEEEVIRLKTTEQLPRSVRF